MRVCHAPTVVFDEPNLVSCAGLAPLRQLAERAGLQDLVAGHVRIDKPGGGNARLKIPALVAGMIAGADSIQDMALLRHGAMGRVFTGVRAPSTLGTFLRTFTFGHVRQLDAVASRLLINLSHAAPLLPGAEELAYVNIDDTVKPTYGYAKEGAGRGYSGVKGLNALLGIVSTPGSAPVITGVHRSPAAPRPDQQREGRTPVHRRHPRHREGRRRDRDPDRADGLGLLPVRRRRSRTPTQGPVLHHRPAASPCPQCDRGYSRYRLDADHVHQRRLRRR